MPASTSAAFTASGSQTGYKNTAFSANPSLISFCCFFRNTSTNTWYAVELYNNNNSDSYSFFYNVSNGDFLFYNSTSGGGLIIMPTNVNVNGGQWIFVGGSLGGGVMTGYLKQVGQASCVSATTTTAATGAINQVNIGDSVSGGNGVTGNVCGVRVWTASLRQEEFERESQQIMPARRAGLLASWPLRSKTDLADQTGQFPLTAPTVTATSSGPPVPVWPRRRRTGFASLATSSLWVPSWDDAPLRKSPSAKASLETSFHLDDVAIAAPTSWVPWDIPPQRTSWVQRVATVEHVLDQVTAPPPSEWLPWPEPAARGAQRTTKAVDDLPLASLETVSFGHLSDWTGSLDVPHKPLRPTAESTSPLDDLVPPSPTTWVAWDVPSQRSTWIPRRAPDDPVFDQVTAPPPSEWVSWFDPAARTTARPLKSIDDLPLAVFEPPSFGHLSDWVSSIDSAHKAPRPIVESTVPLDAVVLPSTTSWVPWDDPGQRLRAKCARIGDDTFVPNDLSVGSIRFILWAEDLGRARRLGSPAPADVLPIDDVTLPPALSEWLPWDGPSSQTIVRRSVPLEAPYPLDAASSPPALAEWLEWASPTAAARWHTARPADQDILFGSRTPSLTFFALEPDARPRRIGVRQADDGLPFDAIGTSRSEWVNWDVGTSPQIASRSRALFDDTTPLKDVIPPPAPTSWVDWYSPPTKRSWISRSSIEPQVFSAFSGQFIAVCANLTLQAQYAAALTLTAQYDASLNTQSQIDTSIEVGPEILAMLGITRCPK